MGLNCIDHLHMDFFSNKCELHYYTIHSPLYLRIWYPKYGGPNMTLEHPWILVFTVGPGTDDCRYYGMG